MKQESATHELHSRTLFAAATVADPFPLYDELRPRTPLRTTDGLWLLMQHDHVFAALSDHRAFSSRFRGDNVVLRDTPILFEDPPEHTRHRKWVQGAFTPSRIAALEPWVAAVVREIVSAIPEGTVDAIGAICDPLPVRVIAQLMGVPDELHGQFKRWSDHRTYLVGHRGQSATPDVVARITEAERQNQALLDYFVTASRARRGAPVDDLIGDLVAANDQSEQLDESKIAAICALVLTAGNVTTVNLLANMLAILARDPALYLRLRDDRSLVPHAVEETLRLESPVQWLYRHTTREVTIGETTIPADSSVIVYFGAANRDPHVYSDPGEFNLANVTRRHAAFGHGIHFCLGAPLGRLEASLALDAVLDRFESIVPAAEPPRRIDDAATHCGYRRLPLVFTRASTA